MGICRVVCHHYEKAEEFIGTIDFCVLIVRPDEMDAVARRCRGTEFRELIVVGRQSYVLFDRPALARVTLHGSPYSQERTRNMMEDFDPHWLMLVGIAGATPSEEFTLGDVVVASELNFFGARRGI